MNDKTLTDILAQFDESPNYHFFKVHDRLFYVRRHKDIPDLLPNASPRFDRTRVVRIEETITKKNIMCCSCGHYERNLRPCRHIYSILQRNPELMDCDIRNLKMYAVHYGTSEKFTEICNKQFELDLRKGLHVSMPIEMDESNRIGNLSFFEEALNNRIVLNPVEESIFEDESIGDTNVDFEDDIDPNVNLEDESNNEVIHKILKTGGGSKKSSFQRILPMVQQLCDQATNEKGISIIVQKLQEAHKELIEENSKTGGKKRKNVENDDEDEFVSFPAIDRRKKDTRLKPYNEK